MRWNILGAKTEKIRAHSVLAIGACILLLAFITICADRYARAQTEREISFFSTALERASADERGSDPLPFHVVGGRVYRNDIEIKGAEALPALKRAYEKTLARRSPLVALPGTDPAELLGAVNALERGRDQLADMKENSAEADLIRTSLYPVDFLKDAADLESKRRTFLSTGSDADATAYEGALAIAISEYQKDIGMYRAGFVAAVPRDIRSFTTANLLISRTGTLSAIDALHAHIDLVRDAYERRLACIRGTVRMCDETSIMPQKIDDGTPSVVPAQAIQLTTDVRKILAQTLRTAAVAAGPVIQLNTSTCYDPETSAPLFVPYMGTSWIDNSPQELLAYVGDIRFNRTSSYPTVPFESFLASHGVEYSSNNAMRHYSCPYMGSDYGAVFAVKAISDEVASQPLSAYVSGEDSAVLIALERTLLPSRTVLKESDAVNYVNAALEIAQRPGASEILSDRAAEIALMLRYRTAGFAQAVLNIGETEQRNVAAQTQRGVPVDLSAETLFYFRSAFVLFYFGDNSSAGDPDSFFSPYIVPADKQPYVFYSQLPHTTAVRDKVIHDLQIYFDFHRNKNTIPSI